jgi:hypothetical protein
MPQGRENLLATAAAPLVALIALDPRPGIDLPSLARKERVSKRIAFLRQLLCALRNCLLLVLQAAAVAAAEPVDPDGQAAKRSYK